MAAQHCTRVFTCHHCSSEFTGRKKKFCSPECREASNRGHDPRGHKCHECGNRFQGRKQKYCSDRCAARSKRKADQVRKGLDPNAPQKYKRIAHRLEYPPGVETEAQKRRWRFHNDPEYRAKEKKRKKIANSPEYKRKQRFRKALREGRVDDYNRRRGVGCPIQERRRTQRKSFKTHLGAIRSAEAINARRLSSKLPRVFPGENYSTVIWNWRYKNDPEFHAKQKARLRAKKYHRRLQKKASDDGTVGPECYGARSRCLYCNTRLNEENRSLDHMVPLHCGGMHSVSNVTECCRSCNSKKGSRAFDDWLGQLDEPHRSRARREYERRHGAAPQQLTLTHVER